MKTENKKENRKKKMEKNVQVFKQKYFWASFLSQNLIHWRKKKNDAHKCIDAAYICQKIFKIKEVSDIGNINEPF